MEKKDKKLLRAGIMLFALFILWTILVKTVGVKPVGQNGTNIGFADMNTRFHELTGVNMKIYDLTDILGIVPILICFCFGVFGLFQFIKRRGISKVDKDIILLLCYYAVVCLVYIFFELVPINYRPIPIEGVMEASYPSSTTLLVLSVMPTLMFQTRKRSKNTLLIRITDIFVIAFSAFMVISRLTCGVHWLTDIIGGVLASAGLFTVYVASDKIIERGKTSKE